MMSNPAVQQSTATAIQTGGGAMVPAIATQAQTGARASAAPASRVAVSRPLGRGIATGVANEIATSANASPVTLRSEAA